MHKASWYSLLSFYLQKIFNRRRWIVLEGFCCYYSDVRFPQHRDKVIYRLCITKEVELLKTCIKCHRLSYHLPMGPLGIKIEIIVSLPESRTFFFNNHDLKFFRFFLDAQIKLHLGLRKILRRFFNHLKMVRSFLSFPSEWSNWCAQAQKGTSTITWKCSVKPDIKSYNHLWNQPEWECSRKIAMM